MGEMPHRHFSLNVNVGQERTLVVDPKGKDAVLVRESEAGAEYGAICGLGDGFKVEAMKRGQHGEFKLKSVRGWDGQWGEVIV